MISNQWIPWKTAPHCWTPDKTVGLYISKSTHQFGPSSKLKVSTHFLISKRPLLRCYCPPSPHTAPFWSLTTRLSKDQWFHLEGWYHRGFYRCSKVKSEIANASLVFDWTLQLLSDAVDLLLSKYHRVLSSHTVLKPAQQTESGSALILMKLSICMCSDLIALRYTCKSVGRRESRWHSYRIFQLLKVSLY